MVDNPGDNAQFGAYKVTLELVRAGAAETIEVECAGVDRADAARRARWDVSRQTGVKVAHIHVVTSRAA